MEAQELSFRLGYSLATTSIAQWKGAALPHRPEFYQKAQHKHDAFFDYLTIANPAVDQQERIY